MQGGRRGVRECTSCNALEHSFGSNYSLTCLLEYDIDVCFLIRKDLDIKSRHRVSVGPMTDRCLKSDSGDDFAEP